MAQAYCVKDKMKVEVMNPQQITMKNGKKALQGTCPKCGTKVFKTSAGESAPLTSTPVGTPTGVLVFRAERHSPHDACSGMMVTAAGPEPACC